MLRLIASCAVAMALVATALVSLSTPAAEASPVACVRKDPRSGRCLITVKAPSPSKGGGKSSSGGKSTSWSGDNPTISKAGSTKAEPCRYKGKVIGCEDKQRGTWSNSRSCFLKSAGGEVADVAAPRSGYAMYNCTGMNSLAPRLLALRLLAQGGGGGAAIPPPPPDPAVLAQQALAAMNLRAIDIGIVPESAPGRIGIIGLPTWMWAENPGANTVGPITRSASLRGYSVTATAKVKKVVWKMGDGTSVSCTGPGTPYKDSFGKKSSPTCGHTYTRQGRYTVTATSYWVVAWAGIGQAGTIPLTLSDSANITMGESQVITR